MVAAGMTDNPMVPDINWGEAVGGFSGRLAQGRQVLLCYQCARRGDVTPPAEVVMVEGTSLCIEHVPRKIS